LVGTHVGVAVAEVESADERVPLLAFTVKV
jgi:hypothetical protein